MAMEAINKMVNSSVENYQNTSSEVQVKTAEPTKNVNLTENANGSDVAQIKGEDAFKQDLTQEKIHKAIGDINRKMASSTSCEYGFDDATNRVTIKIVDKDTDEVLREIPPEKTLEMIAKAWELAGLLVDEKL